MDTLGTAVVHDVKNLLAELALRLEQRGDCTEESGLLLGAAQRLTGLLTIYRDEAGLLQANIDSASPAELLQELAGEYGALFPALDIRAEAGAAPAFWFYDEALVRLALSNAVHNACRLGRSQVRLAAFQEQDMLVLEVADDGPGYPADMLENPEENYASGHGSTGLGLHLARLIAGLHRLPQRVGSIALSNRGGACFRLILP